LLCGDTASNRLGDGLGFLEVRPPYSGIGCDVPHEKKPGAMLSSGLHDLSKTARLGWGEAGEFAALKVNLFQSIWFRRLHGAFFLLEAFIERGAQKEVPFMRSPIQFERFGKTPKILLRMRQTGKWCGGVDYRPLSH
jgi:hypothetical protein